MIFLKSYFFEVLFERLKKPFYILDIIETTPKSYPILICTEVKLVALPTNEWNKFFDFFKIKNLNRAFSKVTPKIE